LEPPLLKEGEKGGECKLREEGGAALEEEEEDLTRGAANDDKEEEEEEELVKEDLAGLLKGDFTTGRTEEEEEEGRERSGGGTEIVSPRGDLKGRNERNDNLGFGLAGLSRTTFCGSSHFDTKVGSSAFVRSSPYRECGF